MNKMRLAKMCLCSGLATSLAFGTLAMDDPVLSECETVLDIVVNKLCTDLAPCTISFDCEFADDICWDACVGGSSLMHEDCGRSFIGNPPQYSHCYASGVGSQASSKCQAFFGCGLRGTGTCSPLAGYSGQFECTPNTLSSGYCARLHCTDQVFTN